MQGRQYRARACGGPVEENSEDGPKVRCWGCRRAQGWGHAVGWQVGRPTAEITYVFRCYARWCTPTIWAWAGRGLFCTYGVNIFIDYRTARHDTEKGGMGGKRHWTDNKKWCHQLCSLRLFALPRPTQAERHPQGVPSPPPCTPISFGAICNSLARCWEWPLI